MKRINIVLAVIIMIILVCITSYASEAPAVKKESFKEFIAPCFNNPDFRAYDKSGNDMTQLFLSENLENYKNSNYEEIQKYIEKHIGRLSCVSKQTTKSDRMNRTMVIEGWDAPLVEYSEGIKHARGYVKVTLKGSYTYNPNTGEIVSTFNPSVQEIVFVDFIDWDMSYKNLSISKSISSNKMNAIFSAKLTVYGIYTYGGIEFDANMGSHKATIKGDADGFIEN